MKTKRKSNRSWSRKGGTTKRAFVPALPPGRGVLPQPIGDAVEAEIKRRAKRAIDPIKKAAADVVKTAAHTAAVNIAGKVISAATDAPVRGDQPAPTVEGTKMVATKRSATLSGRTFKTTFEAGKPNSSAIRQTEKLNGSRKFTQFDTMTDRQDPTLRRELSPIAGFNRKEVMAYDNTSFWSYNDLFGLLNFGSYNYPLTRSQTTYWMAKHFGVNTRIMNQNRYTNVKMKVHWVRQILQGKSPQAQVADAFSPDLLTHFEGTIPFDLQLTPSTSGTTYAACSMDPRKGSLKKSPAFNDSLEVVKTMTRTLAPGDVWEIDYKHHTGSGLKLEELFDKYTNRLTDEGYNENAAAFYYPIFEFNGPQVEAYESNDALSQHSYIGTAPCAVHFEFRKYADICLDSAPLTTTYSLAPNGGGMQDIRWAFKTYTKAGNDANPAVVERIFNIPVGNILAPGQAPGAGFWVIPVITEFDVERGGRPAAAA